MKKTLKLTLALALMFSASSLFAQKFARINIQEVVLLMPEYAELGEKQEALGKEWTEQIEAVYVEYNNKLQEYQKNLNTYSETVRGLKESELQQLQTRLQEMDRLAQEAMQKNYNELLAPIAEKAQAAVDKVAKAGGYAAVFPVTVFNYVDESLITDLTPAVRAELGIPADATLPAAQ